MLKARGVLLIGLLLLMLSLNTGVSMAVPRQQGSDDDPGVLIPATPTFIASDGTPDDYFGRALAISGETVLIGANGKDNTDGGVYVFTRSGINWAEQQELRGSDVSFQDLFGSAVAISGETAIISAYGKTNGQGAVYVFTRTDGIWSEQQKLTASDAAIGDYFGVTLAMSGDTIAIGTTNKDDSQGAVYIFTRTNGIWAEQQKLSASDAVPRDFFGISVALTDDTLLIGASGKNNLQGAVYVFTRTNGIWSENQLLTASDAAFPDLFGYRVAISGDTVVIGATGKNNRQGQAYIFTRTNGIWSEQQILTGSDAAEDDYFGGALAISGDMLVIGVAPEVSHRGLVYIFTREAATWTEYESLIANDVVIEDYFGSAVAVENGTALVGAPFDNVGSNSDQGSVWAFVVPSSTGDIAAFPVIGVTSFTLINARTDQEVRTLVDGDVIDESVLGTDKFNIRANTNPPVVGSVIFSVDNIVRYRLRNEAPYMVAGNLGDDIFGWAIDPGTHKITATAYSMKNGSGFVGTRLSITLTIAIQPD
jgi:hypothetical protein